VKLFKNEPSTWTLVYLFRKPFSQADRKLIWNFGPINCPYFLMIWTVFCVIECFTNFFRQSAVLFFRQSLCAGLKVISKEIEWTYGKNWLIFFDFVASHFNKYLQFS
jgi:hypothetical protein